MSFSIREAATSAVNFITSAAQAGLAKITSSNQATSPAKPESTSTTNSMNGPKTEPTKFFSAFSPNKTSGPTTTIASVENSLLKLGLNTTNEAKFYSKTNPTKEFNEDFAKLSPDDKRTMATRGDPTLLVKHLSFENKISLFLLTGQILKAHK